MKKILSLLLVMLFILAMEVGVYAEDNDDVAFTSLAGGQNIYIEKIDGQASLTVPETLDHTSNDNAITISYDLDREKWENAYFDHSEDKFIFVDIYIKNLPANTVKYGICGTSYADPTSADYESKIEDNKTTIKSLSLYDVVDHDRSGNPMVSHSFTIADVTHDGNSVIVIPSNKNHAFLLKLQDKDGNMTYHTIQYRVDHTSTEAFKIANAQPGEGRIVPDNGAYVKEYNYTDGTLSYFIDGNAGVQDNTIRTTLLPPSGGAVRAEVKPSNNNDETLYYDENEVKNGVPLNHFFDASGKNQETFHIKWFNGADAVIKNEMLTIFSSNINKFWMGEKWVPAGSGDTALDAAFAEKTGLNERFIKYDPDKGLWTFEIPEGADISALDKNKLGGKDGFLHENKPFFIRGPKDAVSVKSSSWHSPLYDSNMADSTQSDIKTHADTFTDESGRLCARYGFSAFLNCATLSGTDLSIFTVDRTMTGYADLIVLQWYDTNGNLIKINEKDGNYIYLEKKPYVKASTTQVQQKVTSEVSDATLIIAGGSGSFKAEYPMQEQADANNSTKYLYMKLTYMDESGNEIQPAPGSKATVYLPYPAGTSYESHKDVAFTLCHYKDENHTDKEEITLTPTPYGLMFETDSFSPFLLSYTLPAGSAENPDTPGSTGGGSYYPSYHGPVQPVLVLPPKTGDITFFGWLRVLLGID
ncbi:MAG: hypothetical protein SO146_04940 [Eubacteriales bacterium]|nr:hypothetical protein [Eubacteriales bacterium]